jgi:serine/threonine protein phosphatase PrpC
VRPALSSHSEIQDTTVPAAADVPLGTPAFSFTTAAGRWQPDTAKDSGDAHATLLEDHLFVLAANRNGSKGSAAIKALRDAKGSNGWRNVLSAKGADATPTVAAFFPGGGTQVELARIGDGQGFRLRGATLTKITGEGLAREVERKTEQVDVGDLYILCSAEMARVVREEEMAELLMLDLDPTNGVRDLLSVAGSNDPTADVNVLVVRVDPLGGY